MTDMVLALNVGSSSLKAELAAANDLATPVLRAVVDRIGAADAPVTVTGDAGKTTATMAVPDHAAALNALAAALAEAVPEARIVGIGHRIVHGGARFAAPVRVDADVLDALDGIAVLAPLHVPPGLEGIRAATARFPGAAQVACFDTAFHAGKPWLHDAFALPARHYDEGLRRYGFHGLSCQSITRTLRDEGYPLADRRIVIAHLGNGCSVTAVAGGVGQACSMGFSTLDGLAMGTRCGRIDPGVLLHLLRQGMDAAALETLLYKQSGLLGLSGLSNDMRDLEASDAPEAARAIDFFVARIVEETARMAAVLGGLDAVVFCGGIGENARAIREAVMRGLAFLPGRDGAGVEALVRATREEYEILLAVRDVTC